MGRSRMQSLEIAGIRSRSQDVTLPAFLTMPHGFAQKRDMLCGEVPPAAAKVQGAARERAIAGH